jgi:hypothetical protein
MQPRRYREDGKEMTQEDADRFVALLHKMHKQNQKSGGKKQGWGKGKRGR